MNLIAVLSCYVTGLLLAAVATAPLPPLPPLLPLVLWLPLRHQRLAAGLLGLFFIGLGGSMYGLVRTPPTATDHVLTYADGDAATFFGRIENLNYGPAEEFQADVQVYGARQRDAIKPLHGRLRLRGEASPGDLTAGDRVAFSARIRRPRSFGTPGEFNYPRYLAARGIHATAFLPDPSSMVLLHRPPPQGMAQRLSRRRARLGRTIDQTLPEPQAALVRSLVIGDKSALSSEQRQVLARAGLSHLFAISGLHLGLVALLCYAPARALYRRSSRLMLLAPPVRLLPPLLLPGLGFYLHLTGAALATQRALLTAAAGTWLLWRGRVSRPLDVLLAVSLLLLAWHPLALFEAGFQLSFAGVLGMVVLLPRWSRPLRRLPLWPRRLLQVPLATTAAGLTTLPLVLWHFHMLAPAALLTNLWAVPFIGFGAVPAGLGGTLLSSVWPAAGRFCFVLAGMLTEAALRPAAALLNWPGLAGSLVFWPTSRLVGLSLLVLVLLLPGAWRRRRAACLCTAVLLFLCPLWPASSLTVTALSVGQGDASLVTDTTGRRYLIDGGGFAHSPFDVGERLVAPALGRLGGRPLSAVILTHDHPDHRNGLVYVLEHYPVAAFWSAIPSEQLWPPLREVLERRRIPLRTLTRGWHTVAAAEASAIELYVPCQNQAKVNDRSVVFYARHGRDGVLLTGDLEEDGVRDLLEHRGSRPVTLLKLPHHGSRFSRPGLLLDAFRPQQAFASLGHRNPFGFPHGEVERDLARHDLSLWRTDAHGTLRFTTHGAGWRPAHWRKGLFR